MNVSGLGPSCIERGLTALACKRFRAGYITGAYEALLAAQTMLKTWAPDEQANADDDSFGVHVPVQNFLAVRVK